MSYLDTIPVSSSIGMRCAFASVLAVATWDHKRSDPQYREGLLSDTWEVVVRGLVFEPEPQSPFDRE